MSRSDDDDEDEPLSLPPAPPSEPDIEAVSQDRGGTLYERGRASSRWICCTDDHFLDLSDCR